MRSLLLINFGLVLLFAQSSFGGDAQGFARCYAQIVARPVPVRHELLLKVKSGQISLADACMSLLDWGNMTADGKLQRTDSLAISVLNNFYSFHRTWFPTAIKDQVLGYQHEFDFPTDSFVEFSAPALLMTSSLFNKTPYKDVLSGTAVVAPHRAVAPVKVDFVESLAVRGLAIRAGTEAPFSGTGLLTGLYESKASVVVGDYFVPKMGDFGKVAQDVGATPLVDILKGLGGGILGQPGFFLLNSGHAKGVLYDGASKLPRKWAKAALESMLCLNLPALRERDISEYYAPNSTTPFRASSSCITCHATMDQMALSARNLFVAETAGGNNQKVILVGRFPATKEVRGYSWPSEPVADFYKESTKGRIFYRSFSTGQLVNETTENLEDLGGKLANKDEFYQCAAKRYFKYFTGYDVALYDRSDPQNESLNRSLAAKDIELRKFVEGLGQGLRETQSLRDLVRRIIDSPYYQSYNRGAYE
ncbi:DUF1585 domain-containing protein [Bdellovibrio bacteriovorus]|uniref:DUF1585 domain-containing protein n=1 Tax=Bdellovibrio bacteriovorus str. Tiberius TaxID=1069642 RepID=K7Z8N0_BDEBC|nr:DUF1585 domain-containing protein [Bdellovibrio bacteriovorus]AFY00809.1 hypothetical protein Bdt_1109 [Bdellovibrio bacteriovorus str. Tiberius]